MKDPAGSLDERGAGRRGVRSLAQPLDQPHAEPPLELADLQAHGRLREVELARGGREAAELDDPQERPELIEVEAAHLKVFLIEFI